MMATLRAHGSLYKIYLQDALIQKLGWKPEDVLELLITGDGVLRISKTSIQEAQKKACINKREAMKLYHKGFSDKQIALKLSVSVHSVSDWRYRRNLPVNPGGSEIIFF
jgi:hypothetical protein